MSELSDEYITNEEDSFKILDEREPNIISFEDLASKIEYQFRFNTELGQDKTDYIKYFFIKVLGLKDSNFPNNYAEIISDDNRGIYEDFMHLFKYNMRYTFGITVDEENINQFEILYNLYYFLVVNPQSFVVDYLLYYHLYKDGYNINEYYKKKKIESKLVLNDIFKENPVEQINSQLDYYYKQRKQNEKDDIEIGNITYNERFDTFVSYAKDIFNEVDEFNMYEIFAKLNEMNPCDNYELLNNEITMNNAIKFESDELIRDEILKRNFDIERLEDYINMDLIDPFFKYIANLETMLNNAIVM